MSETKKNQEQIQKVQPHQTNNLSHTTNPEVNPFINPENSTINPFLSARNAQITSNPFLPSPVQMKKTPEKDLEQVHSGDNSIAQLLGVEISDAQDHYHAQPFATAQSRLVSAAPIQMVKPRNKADALALTTGNDLSTNKGASLAPGKRSYGFHGGRELKAQLGGGGQALNFTEYDVNPKKNGQSRDSERIITGSDGRVWYTDDHYNTFTEIL
jgi:ribonuclease T1